MSWHTFEPAAFFPVPFQRATAAFGTATSATTKALKATDKALRIVQRISQNRIPSSAEALLRKILDEVDALVTGLTTNTQAHMIVIPIRKRRAGQAKADPVLDAPQGSSAYNYVQSMNAATGGTPVFFRTLVESVQDPGDPSKPDFPTNYATAGVCLIAGAETLSDLQVPLRLIQGLFASNYRLDPGANVFPVVQGLSVSTAATKNGTRAVIRWEPLPPTTNTPFFVGDTLIAREIFLIRIKSPLTSGWSSWSDLFTNEPTDSATDLPRKGDAEVIARVRNHGFVRSYTDMNHVLDPKDTYYYTACVRYTINNEVQPMGALSNVARVTRQNPSPSSRRATPPDWYATPSFAKLFPPLEKALNSVRLAVSRAGSRTTINTGTSQMIELTLQQIQRTLAQYEELNAELTEISDNLQALTDTPPTGLYATVISKSSGGVPGFLSELASRLSDTSDDTRPDFSPSSVTLGVVILAGAPTISGLRALIALLEAFFGRSQGNPLKTVIDSFDQGPAPVPQVPAANPPTVGYDAAMRPTRTPSC